MVTVWRCKVENFWCPLRIKGELTSSKRGLGLDFREKNIVRKVMQCWNPLPEKLLSFTCQWRFVRTHLGRCLNVGVVVPIRKRRTDQVFFQNTGSRDAPCAWRFCDSRCLFALGVKEPVANLKILEEKIILLFHIFFPFTFKLLSSVPVFPFGSLGKRMLFVSLLD